MKSGDEAVFSDSSKIEPSEQIRLTEEQFRETLKELVSIIKSLETCDEKSE